MEVYFASRLDIPHYHVAAKDLSSYLDAIAALKRKDLVVQIRKNQDYEGPFLNVFNTLTRAMEKIAKKMPLKDLAETVLKAPTDKSRGNKRIDVGFASDLNSKRNDEWGGVAVPNPLADNGPTIFKQALQGMTQMTDEACQPELKGKVFVDALRQRLFAGTLADGNRIEALRVALTNADNLVTIHVDNNNDVSENFQGVINYSCWLLLSDGKWYRLSLIGYSRKSAAGSIRRRDLYKPLVDRIVAFYHALPDERKFITPSLLDFTSHDATSDDPAKRLKPHADKCVFYGIYIDCIACLHEKFDFSVWHLLALLTNTVLSESPDFFVVATEYYLSLTGEAHDLVKEMDDLGFACDFYDRVFDDKEQRHREHAKTPGQRHQPHYNTRQPRSVVVASIRNFYRLYQASSHLDSKLASDAHFYARAVANLGQSYEKTGVYGAGSLTAQHLVHIAVLCGFLPKEFMLHAEIGESSNSYTYLAQWEGLVDHVEDTRQLLACLCMRLGISSFIAENLVCKFGQAQLVQPPAPKVVPNKPGRLQSPRRKMKKRKGQTEARDPVWTVKTNPYRDSVYPGQALYFFDEDFNLVKLDLFGQTLVATLASCCHMTPMPNWEPVTMGYWFGRIPGARLIPMKEGTRNHLKKMKADAVDLVPKKRQSSSRKRSAVGADVVSQPVTKKSKISASTKLPRIIIPTPKMDAVKLRERKSERKKPRLPALAISDDRDRLEEPAPVPRVKNTRPSNESIEPAMVGRKSSIRKAWAIFDDSDVEEELPVKPVMHRKSSRKEKAASAQPSPSNQPESVTKRKSSRVEMAAPTLVPTLPLPSNQPLETFREAVLSSNVELRQALNLDHFAMGAISFPRFQVKFLEFERIHHKRHPKLRPESLLAARFVVNGSVWYPPSTLPSTLLSAFFPHSVVVPSPEGDTRYHESKAQASLYCFISACLSNESLFAKEIMSKSFLGSRRSMAVLYDPRTHGSDKRRPPFAVMLRESSGSCYFSFVDSRGNAIGPRVEL